MIRFLLKGILRDKQRSLLPIVVVSLGVMLTVFLFCWLKGFLNDSIELNAKFSTGHVKIMTGPYARRTTGEWLAVLLGHSENFLDGRDAGARLAPAVVAQGDHAALDGMAADLSGRPLGED